MKRGEINRVAQGIRASQPEFEQKGRLLVAKPRGRILRGLYLENSSDPTRIYVWVFVQPLYVPGQHVVFNLGKRLGGGAKTWTLDGMMGLLAAVQKEARPFLEGISSPEALLKWDFIHAYSGHFREQACAYSLVALGRMSEGSQALRRLAHALAGGRPWMIEIAREAERLAELADHDPKAAQELLTRWESETACALGIQDIA